MAVFAKNKRAPQSKGANNFAVKQKLPKREAIINS